VVGVASKQKMQDFASHFAPPRAGRYIRRPARADQRGVVSLPPPVADPVGGAIRGGAIAAAATGVMLTAVSRARRRMRRRAAV